MANLLSVGLVFGRGRGVGRPCPGLKCSSLCDFCCGGGFKFRYGSVETVGDPHRCMAAMVVLIFRQLCRPAISGLLDLPETGLHSVEGDPGQLDLDIGRYLSPEWRQVLHVDGGDRAVAMGEVGRCSRKRPDPGPDTARMASVAIGDVAAESRMEGDKGDLELVGAGA